MALEPLIEYIKRGIAAGDDERHIHATLLDVGWEEQEIAEAFQYVRDEQMETFPVESFLDEISSDMPGPRPVGLIFVETVMVVAVVVALGMMIGNTYEFIFDEPITFTASVHLLQETFGEFLP